MIFKYAMAWIPMTFIAILNGTLRQLVFAKRMTELHAHQLSCLTGILLFGVYTWGLSLKWPLGSLKEALIVGAIWLIFTIAFEFTLGRAVLHYPWEKLFQDYNLPAGRLWVMVLLAVTFLPAIVFRLRMVRP